MHNVIGYEVVDDVFCIDCATQGMEIHQGEGFGFLVCDKCGHDLKTRQKPAEICSYVPKNGVVAYC